MQALGVGTVLKNAFDVFFKNLFIALFIAVICGGIGLPLCWGLANDLSARLGITDGKMLLFASELILSLLSCAWAGLVGSWAAPAQIYLWVQRERNQPASFAGAINYGLNRFSRVFKAHTLAYSAVVLGNIVVIPGIIFGLQFAFVDAIATLDAQEPRPLRRSARLTSARRGTIFRTFLVFFFAWWLPYQLVLTFLITQMPLWLQLVLGSVDHLVLVLVDLCMVQLYLDMFRKRPENPQPALESAAAALPGGQNENPWSATSPESEKPRS